MKREQILRNRLEMAQHILLCYSANYAMDTPMKGCETEYRGALEEVQMLEVWLKEFRRLPFGNGKYPVCRYAVATP